MRLVPGVHASLQQRGAELIDAVESLAARIARTPPDVLRVKKLSINRAMDEGGMHGLGDFHRLQIGPVQPERQDRFDRRPHNIAASLA